MDVAAVARGGEASGAGENRNGRFDKLPERINRHERSTYQGPESFRHGAVNEITAGDIRVENIRRRHVERITRADEAACRLGL